MSDFQSDNDSDISSPEERDPNSDVDESNDTDEDIFPDSEDDFNSQNGEITDSQLSEASGTSEADFWSENLEEVEIPDLDEDSGPVYMLPLNATPLQFFNLFFENTFVDHIVDQTNLYAQQSGANPRYWEPTTANEIRAFIGIHILMGVMQLVCYRLNWSVDPFLGNAGMTENRFSRL